MTDNDIKILKEKDANVLVATWYVDDGWYGRNYRLILSKTETEGFKNLKETKQYKAQLNRYANERYHREGTVKQLSFAGLTNFVKFTYCGAGPSLSYSHFHITVTELVDWIEKHPKKNMKDLDSYERKQLREDRKARKLKNR